MKDIKLVNKRILIDKSKIIYDKNLDETWRDDWLVMAGEWTCEDGCLIGVERGNKGGVLFYKEEFDGKNVMLTCRISSVLPATRDVNGIFCAGWDEKTDYLSDYYVCGLNGWYDNKAGIEGCKAGVGDFCGMSATSYRYEPGKEIEFTFGAVDGHCFMVVDDMLVAEHLDGILKLRKGHIGFSPYCTILKIRDIKQYLKAVLFNAPSTIDSYYTSLVAHDMASGALSGKPKYGDPDYYTYNEGESL